MKIIVFIILNFLIFSCGEKIASNEKNDTTNSSASLFNLSLFFSESEQNLSFPIWFNDSMVMSRKINEITRSLYDNSTESPEEQSLKKRMIYVFSKKGQLVSLNISNHYDNKVISSIKVFFQSVDPETGYSETIINYNSDSNHEEFAFTRYQVAQRKINYLVFKDLESGKELYIVQNEKFWKSLTIDTLCRPDELDLIIYGTYQFPHKKYQVRNIVEEFNVRSYSYSKNNLTEINWKDDPFKIKRRFNYNKQGECIGFVESTFGMEKYVSAIHYDFELKENLPQKVIKKLFRDGNKFILSVETYKYK
jgi:hypothetical protein